MTYILALIRLTELPLWDMRRKSPQIGQHIVRPAPAGQCFERRAVFARSGGGRRERREKVLDERTMHYVE